MGAMYRGGMSIGCHASRLREHVYTIARHCSLPIVKSHSNHNPKRQLGIGPSLTRRVQHVLDIVVVNRVGGRPDRFEPRRKKRRPKPYDPLMKPRSKAKREILKGTFAQLRAIRMSDRSRLEKPMQTESDQFSRTKSTLLDLDFQMLASNPEANDLR